MEPHEKLYDTIMPKDLTQLALQDEKVIYR